MFSMAITDASITKKKSWALVDFCDQNSPIFWLDSSWVLGRISAWVNGKLDLSMDTIGEQVLNVTVSEQLATGEQSFCFNSNSSDLQVGCQDDTIECVSSVPRCLSMSITCRI